VCGKDSLQSSKCETQLFPQGKYLCQQKPCDSADGRLESQKHESFGTGTLEASLKKIKQKSVLKQIHLGSRPVHVHAPSEV
jgi:hypothetical protein